MWRRPMSSCATGRPSACGRPTGRDVDGAAGVSRGRSRPRACYFRFLGLPALTPARVRALLDARRAAGTALVAEAARPHRGVRRLLPRSGSSRSRRSRLRGRRRAAGPRHRHAAARAPGRHRPRAGHRDLRRLRARRQPAHARRVPRLGLRRHQPRSSSGVCHVALSLCGDRRPSQEQGRGALADGRDGVDEGVLRAARRRGRSAPIASAARSARRSSTTWSPPASPAPIVPVHPTAPRSTGCRAYPRVTDIPGPVDLAVIVVPAAQVLAAVDDCIAKRVRAICVISAGFSECDAEGRAREARAARAGPPAPAAG